MSRNMYAVAGDCPGNEELALQIQTGDRSAAELLVARNEGYLTDLAKGHTAWCELEDLKQEGAMALLAAAERFDPSYGTKLLTYATPYVRYIWKHPEWHFNGAPKRGALWAQRSWADNGDDIVRGAAQIAGGHAE